MFVLTYVLPPVSGAAFGKAAVSDPLTSREVLFNLVLDTIPETDPEETRRWFQRSLWQREWGELVTHKDSGVQFMITTPDRAGNACGCCGRLVKWSDHPLAGSEDAYCDGCYTWDRDSEPCLPENTAHPAETFTGGESESTCANGSPTCTPEDLCVICHDKEN